MLCSESGASGTSSDHTENADPAGPFGAKSIGEPATEIVAPAIANAIRNATGKPVTEIPATLERVLLGHKLSRKGARGSEHKDLADACKLGPPKP